MKILRIGMIIIAIALIIIELVLFNYSSMSWNANRSAYLRILLWILAIIGMVYAIMHDQKKLNKKESGQEGI